jgi:hypothetical protein
MTGILVDINKIDYAANDDRKAGTLMLAVLQIGDFEESIVISPAKAEEIKSLVEQEFNINIKRTVMYSKKGLPQQAIAFALGSKVQTTKAK